MTACQILKAIAEYPKLREILISVNLMEALCTPFNVKFFKKELIKNF